MQSPSPAPRLRTLPDPKDKAYASQEVALTRCISPAGATRLSLLSFNSEKVSRSHTSGLTAAKHQIRPSRPGCPRPGAKVLRVAPPAACTLRTFSRAAQKKKKVSIIHALSCLRTIWLRPLPCPRIALHSGCPLLLLGGLHSPALIA